MKKKEKQKQSKNQKNDLPAFGMSCVFFVGTLTTTHANQSKNSPHGHTGMECKEQVCVFLLLLVVMFDGCHCITCILVVVLLVVVVMISMV